VSRSLVSMRSAELTDALVLAELWGEALRRCDNQDQVADLELIIKAAAQSPEQRIVVAEHDGQVAGAVYLRLTTLTAVNLEPVVEAVSPHVFPQYRRHGIGSSLIECAVAFAEELGVAHVMTAATSGSREANRFMARLGLGPFAVTRVAPAQTVRAKVTAQRPGLSTTGGRHLTRVLAARRSMKRTEPLH
jgi:N-acetylglutamate synthase-like GNAT family acetyltransferase